VTIVWVRGLRDVRPFPSRQALVDQIERDGAAARSALNV
jgi:FAD synthase